MEKERIAELGTSLSKRSSSGGEGGARDLRQAKRLAASLEDLTKEKGNDDFGEHGRSRLRECSV